MVLNIKKQELSTETYYSLKVDIDRIDKKVIENFENVASGFEKFKDNVYSK